MSVVAKTDRERERGKESGRGNKERGDNVVDSSALPTATAAKTLAEKQSNKTF